VVKKSFAANQRGTRDGKQLFQRYLKLHGIWHMVKESFAANQRGTSGGKQLFQGYLKLHGVSYNRQTLTSTGDSRKNTNNR